MKNSLDTITPYAHTVHMFSREQATAKCTALGVRFRTKAEVAKIKRAARAEGMSFNTFVVAMAAKAADEILASMIRPEVANQHPADAVLSA